jgi:hypothetical protein
MSIARALSEIGPRLAGTPANDRAAELLADAFRQLGLEPALQPFTFTGWQLHEPGRLTILSPQRLQVPCATMIRSGAATVTGRLRPAVRRPVIGVFEWESFDVIDPQGAVLGTLIQRDDGPAIPQCLDEPSEVPAVIVGADWLRSLSDVDPATITVELSTRCSFVPNNVSHNVVASQPGSSDAEILICAHYDTMYNSPGANDNASGADVVLRLAAMGDQQPHDVTLRYVIFSGEEWLQLGAYAYLAARREAGDLPAIKLVLNIDMVGKGSYLWPSVTDETEPLIRQATDEIMPGYEVVYHNPPMRGDHYPFHEAGIPTIMLLWWPDAVYHTPADVAGTLDEARLALSTQLAARIVALAAKRWI